MVRTRTAYKRDNGVASAALGGGDAKFDSKVPVTKKSTSESKPSLRRSPRSKLMFHPITPSPSDGDTNKKGRSTNDITEAGNRSTRTTATAARKLFARRKRNNENLTTTPNKEDDEVKPACEAGSSSKQLFPRKSLKRLTDCTKELRKRMMVSTFDSLAMVGTPVEKQSIDPVELEGEQETLVRGAGEVNSGKTGGKSMRKGRPSEHAESKIPEHLVRIIAPLGRNAAIMQQSTADIPAMELPAENLRADTKSSNESVKKWNRPTISGGSASMSILRPRVMVPHFQHDSLNISGSRPIEKRKRDRAPESVSANRTEITSDVSLDEPKQRRGKDPRKASISSQISIITSDIVPKRKKGSSRKVIILNETNENQMGAVRGQRKRGRRPIANASMIIDDVDVTLKRKRGRVHENQLLDNEVQLDNTAFEGAQERRMGASVRLSSSPDSQTKKEGCHPPKMFHEGQTKITLAQRDSCERSPKRSRLSSPDVSRRYEIGQFHRQAEDEAPPRCSQTNEVTGPLELHESTFPRRKRGRPRKGERIKTSPRSEARFVASRQAKLRQKFDFNEYSAFSMTDGHEALSSNEPRSLHSSSDPAIERCVGSPASRMTPRSPNATSSPMRRRARPSLDNTPIRRRMPHLPVSDELTGSNVCRFDSSSKQLIIDTASVPESVVNAITSQVQACLKQAKDCSGAHADTMDTPKDKVSSSLKAWSSSELPGAENSTTVWNEKLVEEAHQLGYDERSVTSELTNDFSKAASHLGSALDAPRRYRRTSCLTPTNKIHPILSPRASQERDLNEETRTLLPSSRRKVFWNCSDSLAGSIAGLKRRAPSVASKDGEVPLEVSLKKKTFAFQVIQTNVDVVNDDSRLSNPVSDGKSTGLALACGRCPGCQRVRDCQTCESCLNKLRRFGPMPPPMGKQEECMKRRCQRSRLIGQMDALIGGASSTQQKLIGPKVAEKGSARSLREDDKVPTSDEEEQEQNDLVVKKSPWNKEDDWSVDYSFLSEPGYCRRFGNINNWRRSSYRQSSLSSVNSKRSWLFPFSRRNRQADIRHSSRSTVSSSQRSLPEKSVATGPTASKATIGRDRERNSKRSLDPLSNLVMVPPNKKLKGILPIEAWKDELKSVQALLRYDESDQDWV
ncbi:CXXC zinc finger domain containing protein [Nitzschia inconspicua]|uniref:CXXC zinc finger domain containing protein n=1 Tax=Nitzschia inconspicua TaxID=303405 RepID=A0A9K3L0Q9_9STRA|nr:CXXC zinc finger domain containing protein [Nitzschia inconspicua]